MIFLTTEKGGAAQNMGDIKADSVYRNGRIYTVDGAMSLKEAIAVKDGKIIGIGNDDEIEQYISDSTKVTDLQKKTVLPGLIEGHTHLMKFGEVLMQIDCFWKPKEEIFDQIREKVKTLEPGEWIQSDFGWNNEVWGDKSYPTKEELDAVAPDNPVSLGRCDGHMLWVNSKALEIAGITKDTPDPQGGSILKREDGELLGCVTDNACKLIVDKIPPLSGRQLEKVLLSAQEESFKLGFTSVMAMNVVTEHINTMKRLYENGELKLRVSGALGSLPGEQEDPLWKDYYYQNGPEVELYGNKLNIRAVKLFADGSFGSQSAALFEEYSDCPGNYGKLNNTDEELYKLTKEAYEHGFQVITHAIGDKANKQVIDAYEKVLKENWNPNHRFRIEHFQLVTDEDVDKIKELKVLPSMQAIHAPRSAPMAERRIGKERASRSYASGMPWKKGLMVIGGSDSPSSPANPFWGIYAAVTRKDQDGNPESGWFPENCISREAALKSYTQWAAYGQFEEELKGSLEPGKLADFIVTDRDIMTCPVDKIKDTTVLLTVVDGEEVYKKAD